MRRINWPRCPSLTLRGGAQTAQSRQPERGADFHGADQTGAVLRSPVALPRSRDTSRASRTFPLLPASATPNHFPRRPEQDGLSEVPCIKRFTRSVPFPLQDCEARTVAYAAIETLSIALRTSCMTSVALNEPPTRARAREAPGYSLNSRDFRRARSPQARLTECFHMYRLHTKKRPSVARHGQLCCASRRTSKGAVQERIHCLDDGVPVGTFGRQQ